MNICKMNFNNILSTQLGNCSYCGKEFDESNFTKDHVLPKSKGGGKVVPCCYECNQLKANNTPKYLRKQLAKLFSIDYFTFYYEMLDDFNEDQVEVENFYTDKLCPCCKTPMIQEKTICSNIKINKQKNNNKVSFFHCISCGKDYTQVNLNNTNCTK